MVCFSRDIIVKAVQTIGYLDTSTNNFRLTDKKLENFNISIVVYK